MKGRRILAGALALLLCVGAVWLFGVGRQIPRAWQLRRYDAYLKLYADRYELTEAQKAEAADIISHAKGFRRLIGLYDTLMGAMPVTLYFEKDGRYYIVTLCDEEKQLEPGYVYRDRPIIFIGYEEKDGEGWSGYFELTADQYRRLCEVIKL